MSRYHMHRDADDPLIANSGGGMSLPKNLTETEQREGGWVPDDSADWLERLAASYEGSGPPVGCNEYALRAAARELRALRAKTDRCSGDNCMGKRLDGTANWVRAERLAEVKTASERWKDYAEHQELCDECASYGVEACDTGRELGDAARRGAA